MNRQCRFDPCGVPIVRVFGACCRDGAPDSRAGFGVDWGPNDPKNRGGSATGEISTLGAELTAVAFALETAVKNRISAVKIRHKSQFLSDELQSYHQGSTRSFERRDLLVEIERLRKYVKLTLERSPNDTVPEFETAMMMARRVAGLHSSAAVPHSDEHWEEGTRVVDIYGACNDGSPAASAGFGVFWGNSDPRNRAGRVQGLQTSYRAYLTALSVALSQTVSDGYDELIVRSRCPSVHQLIIAVRGTRKKLCSGPKNQSLMETINRKLPSMKSLIHLLPPRAIEVEGQREAERLARQFAGLRQGHVSIYGMKTTPDGIARCGLFWGLGHPDNEGCWRREKHSELCSEILALKRALERSREKRSKFLTVYTDSQALMGFVNAWRYEWKRFDWPTPSGNHSRCIEMCKELDVMLAEITIKFRPGREGDVSAARECARKAGPPEVFTMGVFISGNNEPSVRYGIYWGDDDERNESETVPGEQSAVWAKLTAIRRALEIALEKEVTDLVIKTDYSKEDGRDVNLLRAIKNLRLGFLRVSIQRAENEEIKKLLETF